MNRKEEINKIIDPINILTLLMTPDGPAGFGFLFLFYCNLCE